MDTTANFQDLHAQFKMRLEKCFAVLSLPAFVCMWSVCVCVRACACVCVCVCVCQSVSQSVCVHIYMCQFSQRATIFLYTQELENDQQLSELMSDQSFSKLDPISLAQVPLLMKP